MFMLLTVARVGGARRREVARYWPALLLGAAGGFVALRGAFSLALVLLLAAFAMWMWLRPKPAVAAAPHDPADDAARVVLGVSAGATPAEIRAAFRAKMATAHPDKGGSQNEAARLVAARDRLLKKR